MSKPDPRCDEACMFICSGEAKQALAAANERIKKLETAFNDVMDRVSEMVAENTAEREVSDKLEAALKTIVSNVVLGHRWYEPARAALAEVGRLRSGFTA